MVDIDIYSFDDSIQVHSWCYLNIICHIVVGGVCTGWAAISVNTDAIDSHSYRWVKVVFKHI